MLRMGDIHHLRQVRLRPRLCENAEAVEGSSFACIRQRRNKRPNGIYALIQDAGMTATQEIVLQSRRASAFSHTLGGYLPVSFRTSGSICGRLRFGRSCPSLAHRLLTMVGLHRTRSKNVIQIRNLLLLTTQEICCALAAPRRYRRSDFVRMAPYLLVAASVSLRRRRVALAMKPPSTFVLFPRLRVSRMRDRAFSSRCFFGGKNG